MSPCREDKNFDNMVVNLVNQTMLIADFASPLSSTISR